MEYGSKIVELRKTKGISQKELAERSGVAQPYLSLVENNKKEASTVTLKKIAKVLEIPLPFLMFMALDETDIPEDKASRFKDIAPILESLIKQLI